MNQTIIIFGVLISILIAVLLYFLLKPKKDSSIGQWTSEQNKSVKNMFKNAKLTNDETALNCLVLEFSQKYSFDDFQKFINPESPPSDDVKKIITKILRKCNVDKKWTEDQFQTIFDLFKDQFNKQFGDIISDDQLNCIVKDFSETYSFNAFMALLQDPDTDEKILEDVATKCGFIKPDDQ